MEFLTFKFDMICNKVLYETATPATATARSARLRLLKNRKTHAEVAILDKVWDWKVKQSCPSIIL